MAEDKSKKPRKSHTAAKYMTGETGRVARELGRAQRSNQRELDRIMGSMNGSGSKK